jgi:hypothetical protein
MNPQIPPPRLRLDFYDTAVLLSRWEEDGRLLAHPVSVHDVVSACTSVAQSSGLLPANTLFWGQQANTTTLGIYVPARRWRLQTAEQHYHLPMPPFVFVGRGTAYKIFAVKKRPSGEEECLYHVPCPNVHATGGICQGNTPFPDCAPQTIQAALHLFMEGSLFNADLSGGKCRSYPDDVRQLWAELNCRQRFPLSELVPAHTSLKALLL